MNSEWSVGETQADAGIDSVSDISTLVPCQAPSMIGSAIVLVGQASV